MLMRIIKRMYCDVCNKNKLCLGTFMKIERDEIELEKVNPCNECVNFICSKNEKIGRCVLWENPFYKKQKLNVFICRQYKDLCGPCGKYFNKNKNDL